MPKKFDGEGNPGDPVLGLVVPVQPMVSTVVYKKDHAALLSEDERRVLKVLLDRDRTSKQSHGGLGSLLALSDDDTVTLLAFLRRV